MKISEILAIAGKPGLYKVIASSNKNLVVESMLDGKRTSVPGSARVSNLGDITMYTFKEDVPLRDILKTCTKRQMAMISGHNSSSSQEIKDFVDSAVADLDHDRIYNSDLKKLVQWYNILLTKDAFPLEADEEVSDEKTEKTEKPAKEK